MKIRQYLGTVKFTITGAEASIKWDVDGITLFEPMAVVFGGLVGFESTFMVSLSMEWYSVWFWIFIFVSPMYSMPFSCLLDWEIYYENPLWHGL